MPAPSDTIGRVSVHDYLRAAAPRSNPGEPPLDLTEVAAFAAGVLRPPAGLARARAVLREGGGPGDDEDDLAGARAWELFAARGLIPADWPGDGRRRFAETCLDCAGVGNRLTSAFGVYDRCDACGGRGYRLADRDAPVTAAMACWLAADADATARAEALAAESLARAERAWRRESSGGTLADGPVVWWLHEAVPATGRGWTGSPRPLAGDGSAALSGRGGSRDGRRALPVSNAYQASLRPGLRRLWHDPRNESSWGYPPAVALAKAALHELLAWEIGRGHRGAAEDPLTPLLQVWGTGFGALFQTPARETPGRVGVPVLAVCVDAATARP